MDMPPAPPAGQKDPFEELRTEEGREALAARLYRKHGGGDAMAARLFPRAVSKDISDYMGTLEERNAEAVRLFRRYIDPGQA